VGASADCAEPCLKNPDRDLSLSRWKRLGVDADEKGGRAPFYTSGMEALRSVL